MSLEDLEFGGLYIVTFVRSDPPKPNDFHWGLYLHRDAKVGGTKYHVRGFAGNWLADHAIEAGVFKSFLLIGLCQIARIRLESMESVDSTFRTYDGQLNQIPGLTCRTWIFHVLELLRKPQEGSILLKCDNLAALEQEVLDWSNANAQSAVSNKQPRPLYRSSLCDF